MIKKVMVEKEVVICDGCGEHLGSIDKAYILEYLIKGNLRSNHLCKNCTERLQSILEHTGNLAAILPPVMCQNCESYDAGRQFCLFKEEDIDDPTSSKCGLWVYDNLIGETAVRVARIASSGTE